MASFSDVFRQRHEAILILKPFDGVWVIFLTGGIFNLDVVFFLVLLCGIHFGVIAFLWFYYCFYIYDCLEQTNTQISPPPVGGGLYIYIDVCD